jgi:hypothetical protein
MPECQVEGKGHAQRQRQVDRRVRLGQRHPHRRRHRDIAGRCRQHHHQRGPPGDSPSPSPAASPAAAPMGRHHHAEGQRPRRQHPARCSAGPRPATSPMSSRNRHSTPWNGAVMKLSIRASPLLPVTSRSGTRPPAARSTRSAGSRAIRLGIHPSRAARPPRDQPQRREDRRRLHRRRDGDHVAFGRRSPRLQHRCARR